jgi:hypothetical protein
MKEEAVVRKQPLSTAKKIFFYQMHLEASG